MQYKSNVLKFVTYKNGTDGTGISNVKNYYLVSSKTTGITTESDVWTEDVASLTLTAENNYLWNYEETVCSDGKTIKTEPCIIGMYSEDGVGIESVTEFYGLSTKADEEPNTWSQSILNMTAEEKYLWNYEVTHYSNGTEYASPKCIIGVYGDTGSDGTVKSNVAPTDTSKLWLDTSVIPNVLKHWDGEKWTMVNDQSSETEQIATKLIVNHDYVGMFGFDVYGIKDWAKYSNGVLELGASADDFKLVLSRVKLAFSQSNEETTWLTNQELWANVVQAKKRISVGEGGDAEGSDNRLSLVDEGDLGYSLM